MNSDYIRAHTHSSQHRQELATSSVCGCFHCLRTFSPQQIAEWVDDGKTALCPYCGIDAVVGSASGFSITPELLKSMEEYWFG